MTAGAVQLAAFLTTAWLLWRLVDWAYRVELGEPKHEAPPVAPPVAAPPVAAPAFDPVDDAPVAVPAPVLTGR